MAMKFGLRIPPCEPLPVVADLIVRAEEGGFDIVWLTDTQLLNREVWVTLGVAAARTSRIVLGTNVTNPLTRHSTVTASAAATVDELSPGRLILGIGTGESSVRPLGWKVARLAQVREYVEQMRTLWEGGWLTLDGPSFHLKGATGRQVPVYLAGSRPRMLQLAGEIGDGAIVVAGISKSSLEYAFGHIAEGAQRSGRRLEDLDVAVGVYCYVTDDREGVLHQARPYAALYAIRVRGTERDFGIDIPEGFGIASLYPDLLHAEDWQAAVEATSWVPDRVLEAFAEEFCIIGTGDEVADRIRRLESHGVQNLYIRGFSTYDLPTDICETFISDVIPRFHGG